jgi:DNA-binding transcriptional regulator YiaG
MDEVELIRIRKALGLSIEGMCAILDVSCRTYEKWESGYRKMTGANHTAVLAVKYMHKLKRLNSFRKWRRENG